MKKVKLISILAIGVFALFLFAPSALAILGAADNAVVPQRTPSPSDRVCTQVITNATSPSGECVSFPTPCEVPEGWIVVSSCSSNAGTIIDDIDSRLQQMRKDRDDFKSSKQLEESKILEAAKEKVAAKRKLIEAKREELRIKKEEKRQAVLVNLIDIQIKQLGNTQERVKKMPNITDNLKGELDKAIIAAIGELEAEKVILQAITKPEDLKAFAKELKDSFKAKRSIVKQIVDAILASRANKTIDNAEGRLTEITAKIAALKAAGQDTAALDALLVAAQSKIAAANTKAGKEDLKGAISDLKEAYKSMKSIIEKTETDGAE